MFILVLVLVLVGKDLQKLLKCLLDFLDVCLFNLNVGHLDRVVYNRWWRWLLYHFLVEFFSKEFL